MERAVAPLLLQLRASGRRALSRLRTPRSRHPVRPRHHRDPPGRQQPRYRAQRHFLRVGCRCRTRDRRQGEKCSAPATLIRFRPLGRRFRTRDGLRERCTALAIPSRRYRTAWSTELDLPR